MITIPLSGTHLAALLAFGLVTLIWFFRAKDEIGTSYALAYTWPFVVGLSLFGLLFFGPGLLFNRLAEEWNPVGDSVGYLTVGLLILSIWLVEKLRTVRSPDIILPLRENSKAASNRGCLLYWAIGVAVLGCLAGIATLFTDDRDQGSSALAQSLFWATLALVNFKAPRQALAEEGVCVGNRLIAWSRITDIVCGKNYVWLKVNRTVGIGSKFIRLAIASDQVAETSLTVRERAPNLEIQAEASESND